MTYTTRDEDEAPQWQGLAWGLYSSHLEISREAIGHNMDKALAHLGGRCALLPTVKANAYGLGMVPMARLLTEEHGLKELAVAQVYEGLRLRQEGLDCALLVMGVVQDAAIEAALDAGLKLTVFQLEAARKIHQVARAKGRVCPVHIKIDTGLNRLGVPGGEELDRLLTGLKALDCLRVEGVFTHFATSNHYDDPYTLAQFAAFKAGVGQVLSAGFSPSHIHCCNSGAMVWMNEALDFSTHVRPGSLYMGYDMMADGSNPLGVTEAMSWRAHLTNVHTVQPGEAVGYGRHFLAQRPTVVGTVSVGYGDGLYRPMTMNGGPVLIKDSRSHYLGCSMDHSFVDVTDIDCAVGDEVTIVGHSSGGAYLSAFELERFTGQCYQNALCSINDRVARVYR